MDIQNAFIFSILTFIIVYAVLSFDDAYLPSANKTLKTLRTSLLCAVIVWVIIAYFMHKAKNEVSGLAFNALKLITDDF